MLAGLDENSAAKPALNEAPLQTAQDGTNAILADVPVNQIVRSPFQPRLIFDEKSLEELATSIQTIGLGKPISVRRLANGALELVGGERRWRAVQLNGSETIKAIIQDMSDSLARVLALTDNGGEPLTDYEQARRYSEILQAGEEQSQRALARRLGINVSTVSRCLELMQLPESIRSVLDNHPKLITSNYAKRFVDHCVANLAIVEKVVLVMAESGLQQEAALRLIEKEIALANKTPEPPKEESRAVAGIGSLRVSGTRLEFKCLKGVDAQRLSHRIEEFLRTIDLDAVRSELK
jgi:ParB family chromosome partitioning protein